MGNRPYKRITENVFNGVKLMLKGGASQKNAADYAGISTNTVNRIAKSADYDAYCNYAYANGRNAYPGSREAMQEDAKPKTETVVRVEATHYMMVEMQKANEMLKMISAKLAFIVDELCGTGKKEG